VKGDSPIKTLADLTKYLKDKDGRAAYGSPTTISLASAEVYMQEAGVRARLVRYKSSAQALTDLKAGEIDYFFIDTTGALGPVKRGDIRLLGVTTTTRNSSFPDIPTMQETGIKDFDLSSWFGIFAPADTPQPIRDKLEKTFNEIVARKETKDYLASIAIDVLPGSPEKLMDQVRRQTAVYQKLYNEGKLSAAD
jgi:tripartite-type tricarboxylate transporter receptor subunit TctC